MSTGSALTGVNDAPEDPAEDLFLLFARTRDEEGQGLGVVVAPILWR